MRIITVQPRTRLNERLRTGATAGGPGPNPSAVDGAVSGSPGAPGRSAHLGEVESAG